MIVIPILKLNTTPGEQLDKINEEFNEILAAVVQEEDTRRTLEECFDTIEAITNFMYKISDQEHIRIAGEKHFIKMRDRCHDIIGLIKVILE